MAGHDPDARLEASDASSRPHRDVRSAVAIRVGAVELDPGDSLQRHREKLARVILDEMYQFVALLDPDGTLLEVNRAALEGAGLRLQDIEGQPFWTVRWWTVSEDTQTRLKSEIVRAAAGEFVRYDAEVYGEAAGEGTIIIDFSMNPVRDSAGRVVFLLAEGRNITEKSRAEAEIAAKHEQLQALLKQVRELDEVKSQLFANISHELRTPLALILGPAEKMLADGQNLSALQRRDINIMRRNAAVLLKLVNDLLDVAKLDAGKLELRYVRLDVARLVRRVASNFEAVAAQRRLSLVVDADEAITAEVDPDKLERIVQNLLSNAIKFTPEGGRVKVALSAADELSIAFQDSGPGVPPADRELIFERFRQAQGGATRQFGGTGLGLAITRDFVRLHEGGVTVTDAPGGGALFLVRLPLHAPQGQAVRTEVDAGVTENDSSLAGTLEELLPLDAPVAAAVRTDSRPVVLVAEDNPDLRRFVAECLEADFHVQLAQDGQEALEQILARAPDLLVTDVMMPRLSGDQLVAALREHPHLDRLPVIVLTAKADDALRTRLLRSGAQDYVSKPFSSDELRARVRNLVDVKLARDLLQAELDSQQQNLAALARGLAEQHRARTSALMEAHLARDHARAASEAKSRFLQLVSHELRTPLQAMQLQVDLLRRLPETRDSAGAAALLERLTRSHGQMTGLVNTLLDAVRAEAGEIVPTAERFDADAVIRELVEEMRPRAIDKGLPLDYSGVPAHADTDPHLLRIIASNLIDNAIKYTREGRIDVRLQASASTLELCVSDTGPGIAQDQHALIFEPFAQLSDVWNKHEKGVGLGLHLGRRIAQQLGGSLTVESAPGQGSRFLLSIPADLHGPG